MSNRIFSIVVLLVVSATCAYPIYQLWQTGGPLHYANGHDETSYLQYDFSKATQGPTRVSQFLVTGLHEVGLSGGSINLLFDLLAIPVFLFFTSRAFQLLGFTPSKANLCAFAMAFLPLLFGGLNPWIYKLFFQNWQNGRIFWMATPEAVFPPLVRTPEPQFSFALLSIAAWWALKKRSYWWMYPVLPFLYPFIAVPCGFVVLSLHLRQFVPAFRSRSWLSPIVAFTAISAALFVYHAVLLPAELKDLTVTTRLPMLSFTALVSLAIFAVGYRFCEPRFRFFLALVALAPLATVNVQVVAGWIAAPNAYEQYFGIVCAACVLVFSYNRASGRYAIFATSILLALFSAHREFVVNRAFNSTVTLSDELLDDLKTNPENVAVNDTVMASRLNMLYPKQPATRFGFERSLPAVCDEYAVRDYLRAKRSILLRPELAGAYTTVFTTLDGAYAYESTNFSLLHVGRKTNFPIRNKLELTAHDNVLPKLHVVRAQPVPAVSTSSLLYRCLLVSVAWLVACPFVWFFADRRASARGNAASRLPTDEPTVAKRAHRRPHFLDRKSTANEQPATEDVSNR